MGTQGECPAQLGWQRHAVGGTPLLHVVLVVRAGTDKTLVGIAEAIGAKVCVYQPYFLIANHDIKRHGRIVCDILPNFETNKNG